jgi:SAM-dependent methyltransferase
MRAQVVIARQIARNLRAMHSCPAAGDLASGSELSPASAAAYADGAYRSLAGHGQLDPETLSGAAVLEVGPGETLALALRMIAAGAQTAVAIDRFPVQAGVVRQRAVYRELLERLDGEESARARSVYRDADDPPLDPERIRLMDHLAAENAGAALDPESFDIVLSLAALQHTAQLEPALRSLDRLLAPGGVMAHQIDFGDMGIFSGRGMHPLSFLTVPDRAYRWMGSNLGIPNRGLISAYRSVLEDLGYQLQVRITKVLGDAEKLDHYRDELIEGRDFERRHVELLDRIRPRMLERYRSLPDADLLTQSALIVARKPARSLP